MNRLGELPPSVERYLRDFAARCRRLVALCAVGTALAVLAVGSLVACLADRLLHLNETTRLILLAGVGLGALAAGITRLQALRATVDWIAMAAVIESHDPRFDQRLITVTSRVLGLPEHRGSDEILSHLLREVEQRAAVAPKGQAPRPRPAAAPWAVFFLTSAFMAVLAQAPGLGGPRLLARLYTPWSGVPPVTTTELRVLPGDADVRQSEPFHLEVEAHRLGASPVWVFVNDDGVNWSRYSMDDAGANRFTFTINAVGRDLHYYVSGGDATSRQYEVRVKRTPAVAEFRIRYTYPPYTGKAPFTVTNSDGLIEAPVGADAQLTIVATEPLQSALVTIGDQKILMERTDDENTRRATLHVQRDLNYDLDLISTRDMHGGGPGKMTLRATADHPPLIRLLQGGQTLRLHHLDTLPISWQAMDDYGIETVSLLATVNSADPARIPLRWEATVAATKTPLSLTWGIYISISATWFQSGLSPVTPPGRKRPARNYAF